MKKLNMAILTVLLVFQTILSPLGMFGVTFASAEDGTISNSCTTTLADFQLRVGGKNVVPADSNLEFKYSDISTKGQAIFEFDINMQDHCNKVGDNFTFTLPNSIIDYSKAFAGTTAKDEQGNVEFDYTHNNGVITVTVKKINDPAKLSTNGKLKFTFESAFNKGKIDTENKMDQSIVYPTVSGTAGSVPIKIYPNVSSANSMSKVAGNDGKAEIRANGDRIIKWTVWVNKTGEKIAGNKIKDTLTTNNHIYNNDITITKFSVSLKGTTTQVGSPTTITRPESTATSFEVGNLEDYHAYKLEYETKVNIQSNEQVDTKTFNNKVQLLDSSGSLIAGKEKQGSATTKYGKKLVKQKKFFSNYNSEWTIFYNLNKASISAGSAWIEDTLSSNSGEKHKINLDSIEVYKVNVNEEGEVSGDNGSILKRDEDYKVTSTVDNKFKLEFINGTNPITDAYRVTYKAKNEKNFFDGRTSTTIKNSVISDSVSVPVTQTDTLKEKILTKLEPEIDFENKIMTWKVTVTNDNPVALENYKLTDIFAHSTYTGTHTLVSDDGSDATDATAISISNSSYGTVTKDLNGFTATGTIPAGESVTYTYKTKFTIKTDGSPLSQGYGNKATLDWTNNAVNYKVEKTKEYKPKSTDPTSKNGDKIGKYDYIDQLFNWDVIVNTNKVNIAGAILTDEVLSGHSIIGSDSKICTTLTDCLKVYEYTYNTNNNDSTGNINLSKQLVEGIDYTITSTDANNFVLTFSAALDASKNNKTYILQYQTKDLDYLIGNSDSAIYENKAKLKMPTSTEFDLGTASVTVNNANHLMTKNNPTYNSGSPVINWTIDLNKSLSNLGEAKLKDIPTDNLLLLQDSLVIKEYAVNKDNGIGNLKTVDLVADGISINYTASGGFEIDFSNLSKKAYRIQYSTLALESSGTDENGQPKKFNNEAVLTYKTSDHYNSEITDSVQSGSQNGWNLSYSNSSADFSSTKGTLKFVKKGVNPATGEVSTNGLEGVEFKLYRPVNGTDYLVATTVTKTDGSFEFSNVNYGNFKVVETAAPNGHSKLDPFTIKLNEVNDYSLVSNVSKAPLEVLNKQNVATSCSDYKITIKDIDGVKIPANQEFVLIDGKGIETNHKTDGNGVVILQSNTFMAGKYTVYPKGETTALGAVTVQYGADCFTELQPAPSCDNFTVVLKDSEDNVRTDVTTITLKQGTTEVAKTALSDGKFVFNSNKSDVTNGVKPGTYQVYDGKIYLGEVKLSYKETCGYEFVPQYIAPSCPAFTITLKDEDGKPRNNVIVVVKDSDGNIVQPGTTHKTDTLGQVTIPNLPTGSYTLYEGADKLKDFTVDSSCEVEYQLMPSCTDYLIVVLNEDGNVIANGTQVTINSKDGSYSKNVIVTDGTVKLLSTDIPAGDYKISYGTKITEEFTVTHKNTDCNNAVKEVNTPKACTDYTITVKNKDGILQNTTVILKHSDGTTIVTPTITDANGKTTIPSTSKPGNYKVYDSDNNYLGEVVVSYVNDCKAEMTPTNACPTFTLTVNNVNGQARDNVAVVIKDNAGTNTIATGTTNAAGQITVPYTVENIKYKLYEVVNGQEKLLGTVTVKDCVAKYQPSVPVVPTPPVPTCDKDVTITVTPGTTVTVDGKVHTDSDNDGKILVPIKDLPKNSTLTVTEDGKTTGTVTTGDCEASFTPAPSCSEAVVTLKEYANQTVSISKDGGTATTAKVDADGMLVIPHKDGKIVVTDAQGKEVGSVTLVDCKGTFEFTNACTAATLTVIELANKTVTAEHASKTISLTFDSTGKIKLPFTDGKVTLKDGEKVLGSVDLKDCKGTFVLEVEKEACTYPTSVTIPTEHAGKTATVTNGSTTTNVVVPQTGVINITFTEGTTTVTIEGTVVATVTEECKVVIEKEEIPVVPVKPDEEKPEPVEPEKPVDPTPEPEPEPEKPVDPAPTPEKPTEPKPTPQKPVTPSKPTPGTSGNNPGSGNNTGGNVPYTPGSTSLPPKVTDITNKWKNTISTYPQASITKQAEQDLLTLVEEYENMTESQRKELEKIVDIDKVYDILIAEGVIPANAKPSFLPQTNGNLSTAWTYIGFMLVLTSAFFLLRRRKA